MRDAAALRRANRSMAVLAAVATGSILALVLLHALASDVEAGGVRWFHLDKERNLPTWFSGLLFFSLGLAALAAFHVERHLNRTRSAHFRMPGLWLAVALVGVYLSLDEVLVIHENFYWREIRLATQGQGGFWVHLTQWQVLFLPAIALVFSFLLVFFLHRFVLEPQSLQAALAGIGCWYCALLIESLREPIRMVGRAPYRYSVMIEEPFEMLGALFVVLSVLLYVRTILFGLEDVEIRRVAPIRLLLNRQAIRALLSFLLLLASGAAVAYVFAERLAEHDVPLPKLHRRVQESR